MSCGCTSSTISPLSAFHSLKLRSTFSVKGEKGVPSGICVACGSDHFPHGKVIVDAVSFSFVNQTLSSIVILDFTHNRS